MPSSRQARMTRTAISPRLAMRILCNIEVVCWCGERTGRHPVLDGGVAGALLGDVAGGDGFDECGPGRAGSIGSTPRHGHHRRPPNSRPWTARADLAGATRERAPVLDPAASGDR